jgi:hypothetical protein
MGEDHAGVQRTEQVPPGSKVMLSMLAKLSSREVPVALTGSQRYRSSRMKVMVPDTLG